LSVILLSCIDQVLQMCHAMLLSICTEAWHGTAQWVYSSIDVRPVETAAVCWPKQHAVSMQSARSCVFYMGAGSHVADVSLRPSALTLKAIPL
jgi:hypothetical protein